MKGECYLFFSGYHSVATASDILNRYQINNRIVRAPSLMNGCCSFAVLIDENDEGMSEAILWDKAVKIICR
ncbi:MAG: DUF3343 domain-containing protein [Bacillota bacterium]|nr:DUF3343 domain-containing protein [Bacillota bacterium]